MKHNPPNARFWVLGNACNPVKITLRPGQVLTWCQGGPTDEGWSSFAHTWEHEGGMVTESTCHDGRDCDGRLTRQYESVCPVDDLHAKPVCREFSDLDCVDAWPAWELVDRCQRDQFAEVAGY